MRKEIEIQVNGKKKVIVVTRNEPLTQRGQQ